jgi:hypothetical protein
MNPLILNSMVYFRFLFEVTVEGKKLSRNVQLSLIAVIIWVKTKPQHREWHFLFKSVHAINLKSEEWKKVSPSIS